jgi:uncharacterized membrane protein
MAADTGSLDSDEGLKRRRHRHWFDRLMMLADGVFAIAITFLAADITTQSGWDGRWASLWPHLSTQLDAYATSFVVIAIYWLAHRRFMALILTVDAPVTILTLLMLGLVVLLPPATRLVSAYGDHAVAREVYGALVIAIGAVVAMLWAYAALIRNEVSPEVSGAVRWFLLLLMLATPTFFQVLVMAVRNPPRGLVPLMLVGLPDRLADAPVGGSPVGRRPLRRLAVRPCRRDRAGRAGDRPFSRTQATPS